jgi:hypothetical protein
MLVQPFDRLRVLAQRMPKQSFCTQWLELCERLE